MACPLRQAQDVASTRSGRTAAWYFSSFVGSFFARPGEKRTYKWWENSERISGRMRGCTRQIAVELVFQAREPVVGIVAFVAGKQPPELAALHDLDPPQCPFIPGVLPAQDA